MVPQFIFQTLRAKHQSLTNVEDFYAVHMGFQHIISTVVAINVSCQVEPCFVRKKNCPL
jgi:hypothetical protein